MFSFSAPLVTERFQKVHQAIIRKHGKESATDLNSSSEQLNDKDFISAMYISTWSELKGIMNNPDSLDTKLDVFEESDCEYLVDIKTFQTDEKYHLFTSLKMLWQYNLAVQERGIPFMRRCTNSDEVRRLDSVDEQAWVNTIGGVTPPFRWIVDIMPFDLYKKLLSSPEMIEAKSLAGNISKATADLNEKVDSIISEANESIEQLKSVKDQAKDLEERLLNVKREGNFKLLAKAFSTLRVTKRSEVKFAEFRIWAFILLLVLVPILSFLHFQNNEINSISISLIKYLPIISLELLFFYFMRLFYVEAKSLKSQLVQIDLRLNLCEFIYDYIETRDKTHSDKVNDSWKAFESLIFSPIQPNEDKIPSVMDGTDVLADLAGKILKARA
ncbi:TPA: hypothetical protein NVL56_000701 [Enterobacter hormaechei subsp. xiangfangensis]|nr:hypothetical protein [Enterobacter hormaechei]HCJ7368805.1 hypothetical protein [Enterobacter hormaechei subsp. xiangfangensis]